MEKILCFCFENYETLQNEKYKNILIQKYKKNLKTIKYQNLSFKCKFVMKSNIGTITCMTMKSENLLRVGFDGIIEFILGSKHCISRVYLIKIGMPSKVDTSDISDDEK